MTAMEYQIISNKGDKVALCIDDEMTLGDVRGVAAAMLDVPEDIVMTVSLNGKLLMDDEESWGSLQSRIFGGRQPQPVQRKLFCNVTDRPVVEAQSAEMLRMVQPKEETIEEKEFEQRRVEAMDSMVDSLADNPELMETLLGANPMFQKMKESPEIARMLSDRDTMRTMLRSSVDPQRQRDLARNAELQLSQISYLPGGQQLINHYMDQLCDEDEETEAQRQLRIGTMAKEENEEHNHPDPAKEKNDEPLPNPWASSENGQAAPGAATPFTGVPGFAPSFSFPQSGSPFEVGPSAFWPSPWSSSAAPGMAGRSPATGNDSSTASTNALMEMMMRSWVAPSHSAAQDTVTSAATGPSNTSAALSEEALRTGILALQEMGFEDETLCRQALIACHGDVDAAVDYIADIQERLPC